MPIQVQCGGCGRRFQAADRLAGKRAKCPHCSGAISVPAGGPRPRVVACPDCGNTVSTRASECPHCGCPAHALPEQAVAVQASPSAPEALPAGSVPGEGRGTTAGKWSSALIVHAAAVLLLMAVVGLGVGWWLWKPHRLWSAPVEEAQALLDDFSVPASPTAVSPDKAPATSSDEIEAALEQAAAEAAKRLDGEFRTAHSAKTLLEQTQLSVDLIQALAQGDLDAIPDSYPSAPAPESTTPYQSLYESLFRECLAHLREEVPRNRFSKQAVREAARRWEEEKRALLERQLSDQLNQYLTPSSQPR